MFGSLPPMDFGMNKNPLLIARKVVSGAAVQSVTFEDLDGNASYGFDFMFHIVATVTGKNIRLFINNDSTVSDYSLQYMQVTNGTFAAGTGSTCAIGYTKGTLCEAWGFILPSGFFYSYNADLDATTVSNNFSFWTVNQIKTVPNNIIRLDIACEDSTALFGVGSWFELRRRSL